MHFHKGSIAKIVSWQVLLFTDRAKGMWVLNPLKAQVVWWNTYWTGNTSPSYEWGFFVSLFVLHFFVSQILHTYYISSTVTWGQQAGRVMLLAVLVPQWQWRYLCGPKGPMSCHLDLKVHHICIAMKHCSQIRPKKDQFSVTLLQSTHLSQLLTGNCGKRHHWEDGQWFYCSSN